MKARLYRPARSAVQQGRARTQAWVLEMEPAARKEADPLIGWIGSDDTLQQIQLRFPTREAALAYARRAGLEVEVFEPRAPIVAPKSYSDNFLARP